MKQRLCVPRQLHVEELCLSVPPLEYSSLLVNSKFVYVKSFHNVYMLIKILFMLCIYIFSAVFLLKQKSFVFQLNLSE